MSQEETPASKPKKPKRVSNFQGVGITPGIHQEMAKVARSFGLTNSEFATAAVSYFSERGLNPVTEREREGTKIQQRIDTRADRIEQLIGNLGNRLFGFLQTHEKNLYTQMDLQQKALFKLLASQENSLFRYLTEQEANILGPMLVEIVRGSTDAFIARRIGEQIVLRVQQTYSGDNYAAVHVRENDERDAITADRVRKLIADNPRPEAITTRLPNLPGLPTKLAASGKAATPETTATEGSITPAAVSNDRY